MLYKIIHKYTGSPIETGGGRNLYFATPDGKVYHAYKTHGGDHILTLQNDLIVVTVVKSIK